MFTSSTTLPNLPDELLLHALAHLSIHDRVRAGLVSKHFLRLARDNCWWSSHFEETYDKTRNYYMELTHAIPILKGSLSKNIPSNEIRKELLDNAKLHPAIALALLFYKPACKLLLRDPCYLEVIRNEPYQPRTYLAIIQDITLVKTIITYNRMTDLEKRETLVGIAQHNAMVAIVALLYKPSSILLLRSFSHFNKLFNIDFSYETYEIIRLESHLIAGEEAQRTMKCWLTSRIAVMHYDPHDIISQMEYYLYKQLKKPQVMFTHNTLRF